MILPTKTKTDIMMIGHFARDELVVLTAKLKRITQRSANQFRDVIRIFQPETVLRWHRELVRRKWTYLNKNKGGRPSISKEVENLILRLARENPRWDYSKIQGELVKLSFNVSQSTVRNILDRHGIFPAPVQSNYIHFFRKTTQISSFVRPFLIS